MGRFVIEGKWSRYNPAQRSVVHRTVHPSTFKKLRVWAEKVSSITYADGTCLYLTVRDCEARERVQEIHGYDSLIADCVKYDVDSVDELYKRLTEAGL